MKENKSPEQKIPKNSKSTEPSFQFYPGDWQGDLHLQVCSVAAKGLWIELICLMHGSKEYGYLIINGKKPSDKTVSKLIKLSFKTFMKLKLELIDNGVLRKDERGFFYSKRMVKDFKLRQLRRKVGKLGGHPLLNQKVNQKVNQLPEDEYVTVNEDEDEKEKPISKNGYICSGCGIGFTFNSYLEYKHKCNKCGSDIRG